MKTSQDYKNKLLFNLSLAAFVLTIAVVVLGAFTRLVDAGLGCPDWPGCYGHLLWPNETHEIVKAEEAFPNAPVELDKTWPEMVHRYFAGTLGFFILAIAVLSIMESKKPKNLMQNLPIKLPIFLLCLVILQATFGMWTVTLKLWPKVVTAHLLGGFATLSCLWLLVQRLGHYQWQLNQTQLNKLLSVRPWLVLALIAVIIQIALGGWVSSNYAALACPDFPKCLNQWLPPTDFKAGFGDWQDIGPNYLGGQLDNHARTAIHFAHRLGAIVVSITVLFAAFKLWSVGEAKVMAWSYWLLAVLALQLSLGIANIVLSLPLTIAVAHNAGGALLLLTMITLVHRSYGPLKP